VTAAPVTRGRRLSPTAINRYRTCPRSYWFANVERHPLPAEPSPRLAQANAVHHALERFFGIHPDQRDPVLLEQALRAVWAEHRAKAAFASRDEEAHYGNGALDLLRRFAEHFDLSVAPLARERWVAARLEGSEVFGKVDRIDSALGGVEVVDYKTGRRTIDEDDLRSEAAAQVYLLATEQATGRQVKRVRYLYLADGGELAWEPEREDVESARARLTALSHEIATTEDFPARPGSQCRWCPFALVCPEASRVDVAELVPVEGLPF
jgi:putative RecB family exonuclease